MTIRSLPFAGFLAAASVAAAAECPLAPELWKLAQSEALSGDSSDRGSMLGYTVALGSGVALLGGPRYDDSTSGEAVTFLEQADGSWVRTQRLLPDDPRSCWLSCWFGTSVAMKGEVAAVVSGEGDGGTLRIYRLIEGFLYEVFHFEVLETDGGSLESVATDGVRVAVSSPNEYIFGVGSLANVRIFEQTADGWSLADVIRPPDEFFNDWGNSIALEGDLLVVGDWKGGPGGLSSSGRVSVFRNGPAGWAFEAHLVPAAINPNDHFGWSVAVSGDTVIAGAPGWGNPGDSFTTGVPFVFRKREGGWVEEGMLLPANSAPGQYAGDTVEIEGDVAWISTSDSPGGAIHVFRRESTCWIEEGILDSDPDEPLLALGASLSWSEGSLLAGAPLEDRAYLFDAPHPSASLSASGPERWLVPAVAHAPGAGGERWTSDLVLRNPNASLATVGLFLLGPDGTASSWPLRLAPGQTARLDDVVERKLERAALSGGVLVASDLPLEATSRTFHAAPEGTYGQGVPAFPVAERTEAILPGLEETDRRRTNFGVANGGPVAVDLRVELFSETGEAKGAMTLSVPGYGSVQENRVARRFGVESLAAGWLRVTSDAPAPFVPWISVVDAGTGDAVFVPPAVVSVAPQIVAAAAHAPGIAGTLWRSDLTLVAPGDAPVAVRLELLGRSGPPVLLEIPARGVLRAADFVASLFGESGSVALRVVPDGPVAVLSRTANEAPEGSFGQSIPGVVAEGASPDGASLIGLAHDPSGTRGYRTNLGFANGAAEAAVVVVDLLGSGGGAVGTVEVLVPADGYVQRSNVFAGLLDAPDDSLSAVVRCPAGCAGLVAWASVVDNRSGDPIWLRANANR